MADYSIIADVSKHLVELVRCALCPTLLPAREQIALGAPDVHENAAPLSFYLYSIEDSCAFVPERRVSAVSDTLWKAPLAISLRYIAFFHRGVQNAPDEETQQRILGLLLHQLHEIGHLDIAGIHAGADSGDEPATVSLLKLSEHEKQELWAGFSQPMRPAVYFGVGPLLIGGNAQSAARARAVNSEVGRR